MKVLNELFLRKFFKCNLLSKTFKCKLLNEIFLNGIFKWTLLNEFF